MSHYIRYAIAASEVGHKKRNSEDKGRGLQRKKEGKLPRFNRKEAYDTLYRPGAEK
ncbi:MAG: hypothetical protein ABSH24_09615 [Bryobacteraceae bacterium]